jgi:hypothetical protein
MLTATTMGCTCGHRLKQGNYFSVSRISGFIDYTLILKDDFRFKAYIFPNVSFEGVYFEHKGKLFLVSENLKASPEGVMFNKRSHFPVKYVDVFRIKRQGLKAVKTKYRLNFENSNGGLLFFEMEEYKL